MSDGWRRSASERADAVVERASDGTAILTLEEDPVMVGVTDPDEMGAAGGSGKTAYWLKGSPGRHTGRGPRLTEDRMRATKLGRVNSASGGTRASVSAAGSRGGIAGVAGLDSVGRSLATRVSIAVADGR